MRRMLKNNLPLIVLAVIAVFVCFTNYTPGTILSGWDTLHPEFNFGLALKREIFGVFRSYQGLGAVAAHSDMADLPRIILLAAFDIFLPLDFLRYSYIFLTLILGPIGMYLFLSKHVLKEKTSSFLGGLFYLLNLGTLQQFAVPFEMFVTQYAFLPWLFLFATEYLQGKTHQKRTLLLFTLATLFSAPMAYAATLWYIYFIAFILYLSSLTLLRVIHLRGVTSPDARRYLASSHLGGDRMGSSEVNEVNTERFSSVKKALVLIVLTLLLNSFWILPNVYYILNHGSQVPQANINKLFSEQAFLYNKEFGNIKDIAMLKSFLFDWNVYAGNNHFTQLLSPWIQHLKQPFVESLAYLFAVLAFVGIIYSIFNPFDKLRVKILIALLPLLFLCLFFLFNDNPPTSPLYSFLRDHLSFFKEAYRFPQDKVRGVYTFVFAVYFGAGQLFIARLIRHSDLSPSPHPLSLRERARVRDGKWHALRYVQISIFAVLLFYFMLPAFKGNLISPYMRTKIPDFYFEMFKWFDKEPEGARVANLPIHSFWGWDYYDWFGQAEQSFQGAGFLWFGIKQPVLARDFDRWNPYNEQYYREMSYAIYSQDAEALRIVLEKYSIKYILLDKNVIAPPNPHKVLLYRETQELLEKEGYIQKVKEFGNTIIVYKVKTKTSNTPYFVQNPFYIYPESQVFYEDQFFKDYGNYIIEKSGIYYPFRNLTDNQSKILPNTLKLTQEGVVIRLPENKGELTLPSYLDTQESISSDLVVEKNQNQLNITFYPRLPSEGGTAWYSPITLKSPLPETENIILSINKKHNFILNLTSNTPLSLGTVFLNTKSDNTIAIYPSIPNEEIIPDLSTTNYYIEPCGDTGGQKIFGTELLRPNSFYIIGKDVSLCMTIPLSNLLPKNLKYKEVLLNTTFNYKSNLPLRFCLAELVNGACQNYKNNSLPYSFGLENKDIQNLGLQFQLDSTKRDAPDGASQSNKIEKALYDNLFLSLTYPFSTDKFSLRHSGTESEGRLRLLDKRGNQALPEHPESLPHPNPLPEGEGRVRGQTLSTLTLPFSGDEQLSAKITEFPRTTGLCPNQSSNHPPITKKEILKENGDDFIRYSSEEGTACDHFSYQNLSQSQAYLVAITSRNIKGLPLTICVANQSTKHCDIYASLSSTNNFATDIFLVPPGIKNESGFDVNIRNHGIKKTPAVNDLKSIQIIPIPYKWLSQIRRYPHPDPLPKGEGIKRDPFSREVGEGGVRDVLVLPQSFEDGWKAYQVQSSKFKVQSWVNRTFPFLFGEELKDHVLVNNWANGWVLNNEATSNVAGAMKQFNNETIVTVFLPQYLEYLGFVFLIGTTIFVVKTKRD